MTYIYMLVDPVNRRIRYVGKTVKPRIRLSQHLRDRTRSRRGNWIRSVLAAGRRPEMVFLAIVEDHEASPTERRVICHLAIMEGADLVNSTAGGEGTLGCIPSEETRRLQSLAKQGRRLSDAHRARLSAVHTGKPKTAQHAANISIGKRAAMTDEVRKRMGDAHRGFKMPREAVERQRQKLIGRKWSESERENHMAALRRLKRKEVDDNTLTLFSQN